MSTIETRDRQILVDGAPVQLMCGEIHYFRLRRDEWAGRIDLLAGSGCNAVASYVPWICHEEAEGELDLDGHARPELDLGAFIDLCRDRGLWFFVRPGPFVMAEMKNEGIPYWMYAKHPDLAPVTWDGAAAPTRTLDYLAPAFLAEARRWYASVMPVIAPRLAPRGGNVIAVQLDNEVGMLSWVSNSPDLTDTVLADLAGWLRAAYSPDELRARYPFDPDDEVARRAAIRSPAEAYAPALLRDLGRYLRDRYARYLAALRGFAEESGVRGVPFVVNIHGTRGGRGFTFPIGISQLFEAYTRAPGYVSGSDIYLGDLTVNNVQDLYLLNAFQHAVHRPDQPMTSVEFECGDGNYGSNLGGRYDPSAADFKTRLCVAQGARLVNYYLFCGGRNYRLSRPPGDGQDRIAFTGERHGFAAPVSPEGEPTYTFPRMARAIASVAALGAKLAAMEEEHDGVAWGFIPDYWMTEHRYPKSEAMRRIVSTLETHRGYAAWETVARAMLMAGYRFGAVDVQRAPLAAASTPVLVLPTARYLDEPTQRRIAAWLRGGGRLLLWGEVPSLDLEERPCTVLADALGVRHEGFVREGPSRLPSVVPEGWLAPRPEVRVPAAETLDVTGAASPTVLMRLYGGGICGVDVAAGAGRAVILCAGYDTDVPMFRLILETLGAAPGLTHDCPWYGVVATTGKNARGERVLHLLNLDGFDKDLAIAERGVPLFDGRRLSLRAKEGMMLPLGLRLDPRLGDVTIAWSTAEVMNVADDRVEFRRTQPDDTIVLETRRRVLPGDGYRAVRRGGRTVVTSLVPACVDDRLVVRLGR